jgi:hypothetical protein
VIVTVRHPETAALAKSRFFGGSNLQATKNGARAVLSQACTLATLRCRYSATRAGGARAQILAAWLGWHRACFAKPMLTPIRALVLALGLGLLACDDTGKAIKQEVKEVDTEQVKRDLEDAGKKLEEGTKRALEETGKAIDKVDKKVAEEIREKK